MILTDEKSVTYVRAIVEKFIWRDVTMQNKTLDITYDFFNVDAIVDNFYEEIQVSIPVPDNRSFTNLDRFVSLHCQNFWKSLVTLNLAETGLEVLVEVRADKDASQSIDEHNHCLCICICKTVKLCCYSCLEICC